MTSNVNLPEPGKLKDTLRERITNRLFPWRRKIDSRDKCISNLANDNYRLFKEKQELERTILSTRDEIYQLTNRINEITRDYSISKSQQGNALYKLQHRGIVVRLYTRNLGMIPSGGYYVSFWPDLKGYGNKNGRSDVYDPDPLAQAVISQVGKEFAGDNWSWNDTEKSLHRFFERFDPEQWLKSITNAEAAFTAFITRIREQKHYAEILEKAKNTAPVEPAK
ncbi:MAG: hypothetical protein JW967_01645 [Dehalococcoidales bacterium]|nr:hypothetical protein [Dehalococcoidales bacterium]